MQNIVKTEDTFGNGELKCRKKPIDIILYLLAIVLSMMLGSIFKKTDDSISKENVKNKTKNRNRRYYPVHSMFRNFGQ